MVGVGGSSPLGRTIHEFILIVFLLYFEAFKKAPALTEAFGELLLFCQRLHIDHEAVFHIAFQ